ncbi:TPA: DUF645 family protein, partial [Vibrio cholerae]|nr:DUF645 family protein [Vibrio cholerae]HBK7696263.1 DUF645 family protein [Vibrio cholerae]HDZ2159893.1 DUF645 family protein [Vibrio cholerae]
QLLVLDVCLQDAFA